MDNDKRDYIRHGDVDLVRISDKSNAGKVKKGLVLADGEITGHRHEVKSRGKERCRATLYEPDNPNMDLVVKGKEMSAEIEGVLEVLDEAILDHPDHGVISLPEGIYAVLGAREFNGMEEVRARD